MADGSLIFDTKIDSSGADRDIARLKVKLEKATKDIARQADLVAKLEQKLKDLNAAEVPTEQYAKLEQAFQRADARFQSLIDRQDKFLATGGSTSSATWKKLQYDIEQTAEKVREYESQMEAMKASGSAFTIDTAAIHEVSLKLDAAKAKLEELKVKAQNAEAKLQQALNPARPKIFEKQLARIKTMLERVIIRAALLTAVARGIQKIKEYFASAMKTNQEYVKAVGQLKAALMTLAQPILNTILPAFIKMAQVLTIIITEIARFFSMLTGSSLKASQDSAQALYEQQQALDGVGASAKKAGKALASFDEINRLSDNTSGIGSAGSDVIAPDFSALDDADGKLQNIAKWVGVIGAGLLLWKISSGFTTGLAATAQAFAGLAAAILGAYEFFKGFADAITNGVDWDNLQKMIVGVALAATGLYLAFGSVGAGIALVVGGLLMLYAGFDDIIKNGANLKNTLLVIAGIMATGLGISLLTGSLIPLLVAGIASIVIAVLGLTGNLEEFVANLKNNILGGIIDFITGVFTGDWARAWDGVKKIFKGVWNAIVIVLESAINLIIKGINWLIDRLNSIQISIPDWVPGIGGKSYGINIPHVSEIKIPRLATGAVIPPNREFLAVLGDQPRGTNIEAPLDMIVDAFRQAMREYGGQVIENIVTLDGEVIYRNQQKVARRHGVRLVGVQR